MTGRQFILAATILFSTAAHAGRPVSEALPFTQIDFNPASMATGFSNVATVARVPFSQYRGAAGAGFINYMPEIDGTRYIFGSAFIRHEGMGASLSVVRGIGAEIESEGFIPSETLVNAGLAWVLFPSLNMGLNVKYASEDILPDYNHSAIAADIFLAGEAGDFDFALGVSDLGQKVGSESTGDFSLPAAFSLAGGWKHAISDRHEVKAQCRADRFFSGAFAAGAGAEYRYASFAFARLGYHYGGESFMPSFAAAGLGILYKGFALDLAYIFASATLGGSTCLNLAYRF